MNSETSKMSILVEKTTPSRADLTKEQEKALTLINEFLDGPEEEFVLSGPAGSGKTFLISFALENHPKEICFGAAISHAAKDILYQSFDGKIKCMTIAQLLGMKPMPNALGRQEFKTIESKRLPPIKFATILIIDEFSMIDDKTRKALFYSTEYPCKTIFVGDSLQLPPVKNAGKVSNINLLTTKATLTKSMRFQGPIGNVSAYYRDYVEYVDNFKNKASFYNLYQYRPYANTHESMVYFLDDINKFMDYAYHFFDKYPNDTRILAFQNLVIDRVNEDMRQRFNPTPERLVVGEEVVLNSPYFKPDGKKSHKMVNGEKVIIKSIQTDKITLSIKQPSETCDYSIDDKKITFEVYNLIVFSPGSKKECFAIALHNNSLEIYNITLKNLRDLALAEKSMWEFYYRFKESFLDFSYIYAQSSHKAQGQTIDHVFVMADDILSVKISNEIKMRSLYVAVTRAKKSLVVLM